MNDARFLVERARLTYPATFRRVRATMQHVSVEVDADEHAARIVFASNGRPAERDRGRPGRNGLCRGSR